MESTSGERIAGPPVASSTPKGKFSKSAHLLKRADFRRVYEKGKRHFSANITVFYLQAEQPGEPHPANAQPASDRPAESAVASPAGNVARIGFTVSRALGGSVERNRIRRRTREAVRHNYSLLTSMQQPVDVVINPKKSVLRIAFPALSQEVARAFAVIRQRAGGRMAQNSPRRSDEATGD